MKNTIKKVKAFSLTTIFALSSIVVFLPFSVKAATIDSSPPTVAITSPSEGAVVSGMSSIVVNTSDAYSSCVVTLFGSNYDVSPLQSDHSGGNLFVCGTDMTTVYQSEHGTNLSRVASYLIPASYIGVDKVEFYFDGMLFGTDMTAPYSFDWNTAIFADGIHSLAARSYDQAGNTSTFSMVNVTIDNTPPDEDPVITIISLTPTTSSIYVGNTVQLTAVAVDQYGNPLATQPTFDWMSNATGTATVNASGLVTGVSMGSATITVTDDVSNVSKTAVVNVMNVVPPVTGSIKVEMENGKAEIHIKVNGREDEFKMNASTKEEVVAAIVDRTGLTSEQVLQIARFDMHNEQGDDNDEEDDDDDENEHRERRNHEHRNHHEHRERRNHEHRNHHEHRDE